jgi:hypothetical protein
MRVDAMSQLYLCIIVILLLFVVLFDILASTKNSKDYFHIFKNNEKYKFYTNTNSQHKTVGSPVHLIPNEKLIKQKAAK